MSTLSFMWPWAGLLLAFTIPMIFFYRQGKGDMSFLNSPMASVLTEIDGNKRKRMRQKNYWLGLFFLLMVIALMRPQLVGLAREISRDGRNIMLVLDISESMEAEDMSIGGHQAPRIAVAKDVMNQFIDKRSQDRIGLVVFGSESFLHAPLSFDHKTIKHFLGDAQIGFAGPKTAIGDAIGLSVKKLIEQAKGERVMVLLTDGQNNAGSLEPMDAAKIAEKQAVKIYIVGLGASRMMVDGFFGPTAINPSLSLDQAEPELNEIAKLAGGKYFRARDHASLSQVYANIDQLEPEKSDPIILIPKKELFYWPLLAAVALLALRMLAMMVLNAKGFGAQHRRAR